MKEKERLKLLKQIKEEKESMKQLREKLTKFNLLKDNDIVKEYLKLEDELHDVDILTEDEIKQKVFKQQYRNCDCNHEIYFYIGAFRTEYDHGPDSRDYRVVEENDIQYYSYYCLDCFTEVEVLKREHEDFVKNHKIIRLKNDYITVNDFRIFQKNYYELLLENDSEQAYKKLVKEL